MSAPCANLHDMTDQTDSAPSLEGSVPRGAVRIPGVPEALHLDPEAQAASVEHPRGRSLVYTSEPMATRALGAELRHYSPAFIALVEERLDLEPGALGAVVGVQCEAKARMDVLLTLAGATAPAAVPSEPLLLGVEAKFDHALTAEQLDAEQAVAPYLVLLVVDEQDAVDHLAPGRCVVTWAEAISCFPGSRLTIEDISSIPVTKMRVERLMRAEAKGLIGFGDDWSVEVLRGGSGMPSITMRSPELPDGRQLRGQIQVCGRGMPERFEDLTFEYHVGIGVDYSDSDFPDPLTATEAPGWVEHLRTLESVIGGEDGQLTLRISGRRAANGGGDLGARKLALVEKFLDDKAWLAKGYTDWALGVKSTPTPAAQLRDLCWTAQWIFTKWWAATQRRPIG